MRMPVALRGSLLLLLTLCLFGCDGRTNAPATPQRPRLRVAIAGSLTDVMNGMSDLMSREIVADVEWVPGGSGALAKQIEDGLNADVFLCDGSEWLDELDRKKLVVEGTRRDFAGNRLVVAAPASAASRPSSMEDLPFNMYHPIATGDPSHVPSGRYARQALEASGIWGHLKDHLFLAPDERAALAAVSSGKSPVAIVYQTEVTRRSDVVACFAVDPKLHQPIIYTGVVVKGTKHEEAARRLLGWLVGPRGVEYLRRDGFLSMH